MKGTIFYHNFDTSNRVRFDRVILFERGTLMSTEMEKVNNFINGRVRRV